MKTLLFQLINMLPIWLINYVCSVLTVYSCSTSGRRFKWVALCMFLKLLLVNILFEVLFLTIFGMADWTQWLNVVYHLFSYIIFVTLCKSFLRIPWEKFAIIFIIADIRTMLCSFVPVTVISYLFHYNIIENITKFPTIYNWLIVPLSILVIWLTQRIGKKPYNYIKNKSLKYPRFWRWILIFYIMGAIHSSCKVELFYPFIFIAIFLTISFIFYFAYREKKRRLLELTNRYLLLQKDMVLQYYESLKEQIDLTKKMRHDINNHMQIIERIQRESHTEILDSYTIKLREQYEQLKPIYYCDNMIINALISNKSGRCQKEDIVFEVNLNGLILENISEFDFASILFNLLDNAVESCLKISDREKRFICLNCYTDAGQLIIHVENSCNEKESEVKTKFFAPKSNRKQHGMGISIIYETVKKYRGSMDVKHQECRYETLINIPMEE